MAELYNALKISDDTGTQITETSTATGLADLMNTADSGSTAGTDANGNAVRVWLNTEGDIRWQSKNTPTTTRGIKLAEDQTVIVNVSDLNELKLIASTDTLVNIILERV